MVLRAGQSKARLAVRTSAQPPQVTNQLEAQVHYLLLRDARGAYWTGEKIAADAAASLAPTDLAQASLRLQKLYRENPLALPRGFDPEQASDVNWLIPQGFGGNIDSSNPQPAMASGLLEANLAAAMRPTFQPLEKGTYIAVLARSPVVPYGVPRVREEASLHVLRGRW